MERIIKNGTILIIEDDAEATALYSRLVIEGYSCFETHTGLKAFERLVTDPIDVTILDISIQNNSGIELLQSLVQGFPNTSIIAVADTVEPKTMIHCMKSGAQDFLFKPFEFESVIQTIEETLHKRQIEAMLKAYQAGLEGKVSEQAKQIRELYLQSVDTLIHALEAKDAYTAGHSRRVCQIAYLVSRHMSFSETEKDDLCWGALLHDVGKIAIDPKIQNKPGKLTAEEYEQVMKHIQIGPRIVKTIANDNIINVIKYHHTRYDDKGSSLNSENEAVSVATRIVTLADAFDAMTSDRPYRKALSLQDALLEVKRCTGSQFDPGVVEAFLKVSQDQLLSIIDNEISDEIKIAGLTIDKNDLQNVS